MSLNSRRLTHHDSSLSLPGESEEQQHRIVGTLRPSRWLFHRQTKSDGLIDDPQKPSILARVAGVVPQRGVGRAVTLVHAEVFARPRWRAGGLYFSGRVYL